MTTATIFWPASGVPYSASLLSNGTINLWTIAATPVLAATIAWGSVTVESRPGSYAFTVTTGGSLPVGIYGVDLVSNGGATVSQTCVWISALTGTFECQSTIADAVAQYDSNELPIVSPTSIVSAFAGSTVTLISPFQQNGQLLTLTTGDSYVAEWGTSLEFAYTGLGNLVGMIPHLRLTGNESDIATAPAISGASGTMTFHDVPASVTSSLTPGTNIQYQIRAEDGAGNETTILIGYAVVTAGI